MNDVMVTSQEQIDHMKLTVCAMPPVDESFVAAEMIWGRGLKDLPVTGSEGYKLLQKFIGYYHKSGQASYMHHWLDVYQQWGETRNRHDRDKARAIEFLRQSGYYS